MYIYISTIIILLNVVTMKCAYNICVKTQILRKPPYTTNMHIIWRRLREKLRLALKTLICSQIKYICVLTLQRCHRDWTYTLLKCCLSFHHILLKLLEFSLFLSMFSTCVVVILISRSCNIVPFWLKLRVCCCTICICVAWMFVCVLLMLLLLYSP